jgi:hypothetical protein
MSTIQTARDLNVYRELPAMPDGFIPAVRREYVYTGPAATGSEPCNMQVELIAAHPSIPNYYRCRAVFAFNCWHCPDYVYLSDLSEIR